MKTPNFFVVGAPRCGTTALHMYLREHPAIYMPLLKELHYFASDFPDVQKIIFRSDEEYLRMFELAQDRHLAVGEISPLYLYSSVALERIRAFNPQARIVLALRNPIDFVQSMHQLNLGLMREDEHSLARAWDLQEERRHGRMVPPRCRETQLVLYGDLGMFGRRLEQVYRVFPKDKVYVILFDDFAADPAGAYASLQAFLQVPHHVRAHFPQVNAGFEQRSLLVGRMLHPTRPIYRLFIRATSAFGVDFMKNVSLMYGRLELLNLRQSPRPPIPPELHARLRDYFREDIRTLGRLLDRDLSHWLKP